MQVRNVGRVNLAQDREVSSVDDEGVREQLSYSYRRNRFIRVGIEIRSERLFVSLLLPEYGRTVCRADFATC